MSENVMSKLIELVTKYGYTITFEEVPRHGIANLIGVVFRKSGEGAPCLNLRIGDRDGHSEQIKKIEWWLDAFLMEEIMEELKDESEHSADACTETGDAAGDQETDC